MLSQAIVGLRRLRVQRHLAHISSKRNFSHGDGSGQGSSGGGANGARCVLVTGAASGIGLACACLLAEQGWRVALADCIETSGRKAAARIRELHPKSEARFYRLDVRDEAQTEETVSKALLDFGQLDGAIANAGVVFQKPFLETSTEEFKRVVDVNLLGAFLTGRTVARAMVAQGTGGAIVNMSSVNASLVIPGMTGYVASKGGLQQLTRLMAIELSPYSIRVNAIAPGSVGTEMAYATYVCLLTHRIVVCTGTARNVESKKLDAISGL
eukprot:SAG31_NODE_1056_length_10132_cov_2.873816_6_plen_269_part_00